jgi:WD40 repeat protein
VCPSTELKRVAAGAVADGTVRIWDVATDTVRTTLTGHTGPVQAVAIADYVRS